MRPKGVIDVIRKRSAAKDRAFQFIACMSFNQASEAVSSSQMYATKKSSSML